MNRDMAKTFRNFIGGEWIAPRDGGYFENRNPADRSDLIGRFPDSTAADVNAAVRSAEKGFALWSRLRPIVVEVPQGAGRDRHGH